MSSYTTYTIWQFSEGKRLCQLMTALHETAESRTPICGLEQLSNTRIDVQTAHDGPGLAGQAPSFLLAKSQALTELRTVLSLSIVNLCLCGSTHLLHFPGYFDTSKVPAVIPNFCS